MIELDTTIEIVGGNKEITDAFISYNDFEDSTDLWNVIGQGSGTYTGSVTSTVDGTFPVPYIMQIWGKFNNNANATIFFDVNNKKYPTKLYVLSKDTGWSSGELSALYQPNQQIMIGNTLYYRYIVSQAFYAENRFIETANFYDIRLSSGINVDDVARFKSEEINNTNKSITFTFYMPSTYAGAEINCTYEITWSDIERIITTNSPIVPIRNVYVEDDNLRIGFSTWSEPKSTIKISRIDNGDYLYLNKNQIVSNSISFFDREDTKMPQYGVVSEGGNLQYLDTDEVTLYYIENGLAKQGLKVVTTLKNSLTDKKQIVSVRYTSQWEYDEYDKKVTVSLTDGLEEWQDIIVPAINYDARNPKSQNGKWYYDYLYKYTPTKYKMLSFEELDSTTKNVLTSTEIPYPYLVSTNLFAQWNKLCYLCQLHIYSQFDGKTICKYNGGN